MVNRKCMIKNKNMNEKNRRDHDEIRIKRRAKQNEVMKDGRKRGERRKKQKREDGAGKKSERRNQSDSEVGGGLVERAVETKMCLCVWNKAAASPVNTETFTEAAVFSTGFL